MAIVSAETFVQVRAAAQLVCVEHVRNRGIYDLAEEQGDDDRSSPCSAGIDASYARRKRHHARPFARHDATVWDHHYVERR